MARTGRYRIRTRLRGLLPYVLADRIPKGPRNCGAHEWYRRDDQWADCYHCEVGIRRLAPGEKVGQGTPPTTPPTGTQSQHGEQVGIA